MKHTSKPPPCAVVCDNKGGKRKAPVEANAVFLEMKPAGVGGLAVFSAGHLRKEGGEKTRERVLSTLNVDLDRFEDPATGWSRLRPKLENCVTGM